MRVPSSPLRMGLPAGGTHRALMPRPTLPHPSSPSTDAWYRRAVTPRLPEDPTIALPLG